MLSHSYSLNHGANTVIPNVGAKNKIYFSLYQFLFKVFKTCSILASVQTLPFIIKINWLRHQPCFLRQEYALTKKENNGLWFVNLTNRKPRKPRQMKVSMGNPVT